MYWLKFYSTILCFFALTITEGCGNAKDTIDYTSDKPIELGSYYPMDQMTTRTFEWTNRRGDQWQGKMRMTDVRNDPDETIMLVTDTIIRTFDKQASHSAYLRNDAGVQHLYRVNSTGDSTCFSPPRLVMPGRLSPTKPVVHSYSYRIFDSQRNLRQTVEVAQMFTLKYIKDLETEFGSWKSCIVIELSQDFSYSDTPGNSTKTVFWLAENIGPVKIVSEPDSTNSQFEGEEVGLLVNVK